MGPITPAPAVTVTAPPAAVVIDALTSPNDETVVQVLATVSLISPATDDLPTTCLR